MNQIKNQKLGFDFSVEGKGYDAFREQRYTKEQRQIREITVQQAKDDILATDKYSEVLSVIGGGKEATVLLAREKISRDLVCAKVFRYYTSTIRKRLHGTRHVLADTMAQIAAKQEYWNLDALYTAGIRVPRPRLLLDNILIMDFIASSTNEYKPAPLLGEVDLSIWGDPIDFLQDAIEIPVRMFVDVHFVHGDYSDHNLMFARGKMITMDVSQSMAYNHNTFTETPVRMSLEDAVEILRFDLQNLSRNFRKRYRILFEADEIVDDVIRTLPQRMQNHLRVRGQRIQTSNPLYDMKIREGKRKYRHECARGRKNPRKRSR